MRARVIEEEKRFCAILWDFHEKYLLDKSVEVEKEKEGREKDVHKILLAAFGYMQVLLKFRLAQLEYLWAHPEAHREESRAVEDYMNEILEQKK